MKNYRKIAWRYLFEQRRRTLLTLSAITLAVALLTAAGVFAESIRELGTRNIRARFGGFYATLEEVRPGELSRLRNNILVDTIGASLQLDTIELAEGLLVRIHAVDEDWAAQMRVEASAGRLPAAEGELAIERWILDAAGIRASVGDTINLSEREYRIVGFLAPSSAGLAQGAAGALIPMREATNRLEDPRFRVGFTTADEVPIQTAIAEVVSSIGRSPSQISQNTALLTALGEGRVAGANRALQTVEAIVAAILLVATVAVIYNSFAISVTERLRQFGLLRIVGSTPRQLRGIVMRQAGILGSAGALLGVLAGLAAVRIVILVFNGLSSDIGLAGVSMTYPLYVLLGAPVLGLLAVFASAFAPARTAGRASPMEAIGAEGRFLKLKAPRGNVGLMQRLFGVAGRLAAQNIRRHPGRFSVTVFSIGIAVALFITFSGVFTILSAAATSIQRNVLDRDLTVALRGAESSAISQREYERIAELPGVETVAGIYTVDAFTSLNTDSDAPSQGSREDSEAARAAARLLEGEVIPVSLFGLDQAGFDRVRPLILRGARNLGALREDGGVIVPEGPLDLGDELTLAVGDTLHRLPVVAVASELPLGGQNPISLVMSLASARELREGSNPESGYNGLRVAIESGADPDSVSRAIRAVTGNRPNLFVVDVREQAEDQRSITVQLSILLYGLVAVIALIGGLNIVNTITTNVLIRVREFGILRAVGMSRSQMRRMIRLESFLYGSWAVLGGGIVGVALTRIIFSNVNQVQSIPWRLPLPSLGISFAAAVAICLISAVPPLRRVENLSIVDSIRSRQ